MTNQADISNFSTQRMTSALLAAKNDREQLDRLLEVCRPLLTLMARQSLGAKVRTREGDSDVVQMTVIEVCRDFGNFQGQSPHEFFAWLKQMHRHNIQNVIRYHHAEKRDLRRDTQLQTTNESDASLSWYVSSNREISPAVAIVNAEKEVALAKAIESLPDSQRTAITMRHIDGASLAEICGALEKTPAAVAGLLRRGLQTLRDSLASESSWV